MVVEYLGTAYAGFQRQNRGSTVQATLEEAIAIVTGEEVSLAAAGRTDAGAHATCQVATFFTESQLSATTLRNALNARLPRDIAVFSVSDVLETFNPRHDAVSRTYRYLILNREVRSPFWESRAWHVRAPLDVSRMHSAAQMLLGQTDLTSFVPTALQRNKVRSVLAACCSRNGDLVSIEVTATGFMKQMMRAIVGSLVEVGLQRLSEAEMRTVVDARDRTIAPATAPAHGLYLTNVQYSTAVHADHSGPLAASVPEETR